MTIPSLTPLSTPPSRTTGNFDEAMDITLVELDRMVEQLNETIPAINGVVADMEARAAGVSEEAAAVAAAVPVVQGDAATAAGAATAAEAASAVSEAARDVSLLARDASADARDASEAARDWSVAARDGSVEARDGSVAARDEAEAARDVAVAMRLPAHYDRTSRWHGARTTLTPPAVMSVAVGEVTQRLTLPPLDITQAANWGGVTDYLTGASRAGRDFYVYALSSGGLILSPNATAPAGHNAATARRVGGVHCLCADVGVISGHPLSGYLAGDILPDSVWDLIHRPVCSPEGMVYVEGLGKWVDIYLASVSGGALVSVFGGTTADGASSPAFHWYKFSQWLGQIGKRLPTQHEFMSLSLGSNQGTNIVGSADPVTTGGHVDTAGRRMISNAGCEDCCGALWQWGQEPGGGAAASSWAVAFDGNDSGVAGHHYQVTNRSAVGGDWGSGVHSGSRSSAWCFAPLTLSAPIGARGVAEPSAISL